VRPHAARQIIRLSGFKNNMEQPPRARERQSDERWPAVPAGKLLRRANDH